MSSLPKQPANVRPKHRPWHALLVIFSFMVLLAAIVFNGLNGFKAEIFIYGAWGADAPYPGSGAEPHRAVFALIWAVIFLYQIIWNIYGLYTLGRVGPDGAGYLYHRPPYTPPAMYVFFILANGFSTAWIFVWDRVRPDISLALIALIPFTLYLSIVFSVRGLSRHGLQLYQSGYDVHIRLARGMIQNGMAFYATWTTIATLLNLSEVLQIYAGVDQELSVAIILGVLSAELILYLILDWCVLERYTRYIFTPYFVLVCALSGSVVEHFDRWTVRTIFLLVLLGVSIVAMLVKLTMAGRVIQTHPDHILLAAGFKSHTEALANVQYPPELNPYYRSAPASPVVAPGDTPVSGSSEPPLPNQTQGNTRL